MGQGRGAGARVRAGVVVVGLVLAGALSGCGSSGVSSAGAYSPWSDARLDQSCGQFLADTDVAAKTRFVDEAAKGYHLNRAGQAGLEPEVEAACTGHEDLELLGALLAIGCGKPFPAASVPPTTPVAPGADGAPTTAPTAGAADPAAPTTAASFRAAAGGVVDPGGAFPRAGGGSGGSKGGGSSSGGSKSGGSKSGGSSSGGSSSGGNTPTTRSSSSGNSSTTAGGPPATDRDYCA